MHPHRILSLLFLLLLSLALGACASHESLNSQSSQVVVIILLSSSNSFFMSEFSLRSSEVFLELLSISEKDLSSFSLISDSLAS